MNILEPLIRPPSDIYLREFQEQMEDWGIEKPDLHFKYDQGTEWFYVTNTGAGIFVLYEESAIYLNHSGSSRYNIYDKRWYLPEDRNKRMLAYSNIVKYLRGEKEL